MREESNKTIKPGIYRHYKGARYQVYEVATHSESLELVAVYRCLYGDYGLWVRPVSMFHEWVDVDGEQIARFSWEAESPTESKHRDLRRAP